jgi:hypothetical protein
MTFDAGEFNSIEWFKFLDAPLGRSDPHLGRFIQKISA